MATNIQIHDIRLSLIWVETSLTLLQEPIPADIPFAFLGRRPSYRDKFTELQSLPVAPGKLSLPWPNRVGQRFWTFYLEGKAPGSISGNKAWASLLPLRRKETSALIEVPWSGGHFLVESYFYPFGLVLVITLRCRSQLLLHEAVDILFKIKRSQRVNVQWNDKSSEPLTLDMVADLYLKNLRKEAFGQYAASDYRPAKPFTLLTVVQGSGVDPTTPVTEGEEIHRMLEAVTTWQPTWQYDVLPELAKTSLHIRRSPPSHILYGRARGRAIWFPGLFTQKTGKLRSLTCYHRNLVFTSLQVESLCGLISLTAKNLQNGIPLHGCHRDCAKRAAGILGRLYGGVNTYRSWSPKAQIEQNKLVEVLNEVRVHFNMKPLHNGV